MISTNTIAAKTGFTRRGPMPLVLIVMTCLMHMGAARARGGLAAYHLHTGAYVTAVRYGPVGSLLNVSNPRNGRSILVRVNDRGPIGGGRILDLSTGAFTRLFGGLGRGTGYVNYVVVGRGAGNGAGNGTAHTRKTRRRHRFYQRRRCNHH